MQLVGITGPIGHGKSSLAEAFMAAEPTARHLESFYLIAEVADALQARVRSLDPQEWLRTLEEVVHQFTDAKVTITGDDASVHQKLELYLEQVATDPELAKQSITNDNKEAHRALLQWIGGYVTTCMDGRLWYKELVRRAQEAGEQGAKLVVIGGLRFPSDAEVLHDAGGIIINITRPGAPVADMSDPTEKQREMIPHDCVVINDGSLEQLTACAESIWKDLQARQLQAEYHAGLL